MKKKLLIGLLMFVGVLGLIGCNGEVEDDSETGHEEYGEEYDEYYENGMDFDDLFGDGFVNGVFRDELAGFEFHLPDGWTYFPEYALLEVSSDMSSQSGQMMYYTLIANDATNDTGLVVIYEDMTVDDISISMTADDIIDEMSQVYIDRADVRAIGEIFTVEIAGYDYEAFRVYFYEFQGLEDGTLTFFARRIDDLMLTMSISGPVDNDVLDYFKER